MPILTKWDFQQSKRCTLGLCGPPLGNKVFCPVCKIESLALEALVRGCAQQHILGFVIGLYNYILVRKDKRD
jgi:hypothetical protein